VLGLSCLFSSVFTKAKKVLEWPIFPTVAALTFANDAYHTALANLSGQLQDRRRERGFVGLSFGNCCSAREVNVRAGWRTAPKLSPARFFELSLSFSINFFVFTPVSPFLNPCETHIFFVSY
jgi:hypothetical protein